MKWQLSGGTREAEWARLKQLPHEPEVVVMAANGDPKAAEFALRYGVWDDLPLQVRVQIVYGSLEASPEKNDEAAAGDEGVLPGFMSYQEASERKYLQDLMNTT